MASKRLSQFSICTPKYPSDLPAIRKLFTAYAESLNIDLSFQDFSTELASLPGKYSPPDGTLLLDFFPSSISGGGEAVGCIAIRPLPSSQTTSTSTSTPTSPMGQKTKICEMKRLYCTPATRGLGVGRALAEKAIEVARELGYEEMRLDTLPSMGGAQKLYASLGFVEIEAYYETPLEGTKFLSKDLR